MENPETNIPSQVIIVIFYYMSSLFVYLKLVVGI